MEFRSQSMRKKNVLLSALLKSATFNLKLVYCIYNHWLRCITVLIALYISCIYTCEVAST